MKLWAWQRNAQSLTSFFISLKQQSDNGDAFIKSMKNKGLFQDQSLKVSLSLVLLALSYSYQKTKLRPFPSALSFFCNISIFFELPYLISQIGPEETKKKYKNIRHFFHCKQKELQSDIFFLGPLFTSGRSGDGGVWCITTSKIKQVWWREKSI